MMSDQEMNERIRACIRAAAEPDEINDVLDYIDAVRLCQHHQHTAAAEGLLEAAERMVGIELGEKE